MKRAAVQDPPPTFTPDLTDPVELQRLAGLVQELGNRATLPLRHAVVPYSCFQRCALIVSSALMSMALLLEAYGFDGATDVKVGGRPV